MAKLINRYALFDAIRNITYNSKDADAFFEEVLEVITEQPTTSESEIRAKAIEEFEKEIEAEYDNDGCPNVTDYLDYKISLRDLFRIAEQLKERD